MSSDSFAPAALSAIADHSVVLLHINSPTLSDLPEFDYVHEMGSQMKMRGNTSDQKNAIYQSNAARNTQAGIYFKKVACCLAY